jgi:four helix bundle protein
LSSFKRFEDIQAWQKARVFTRNIYLLSGDGEFGKDFDLRRQIRRSSVSIMANIAEGQGRRSDKDFAHFLNMSLGSIAESKSHLYLALDLGYLAQPQFEETYEALDEIGRMVFALNSHLRSSATSETSRPSQTSQTSQTS